MTPVIAMPGRRRDPRHHDRERDDERHERPAERAVRVERGAGGARVLADELGVRARGQRRDREPDRERQPDRATDEPRQLADERVDAGAEDVADDEDDQHPAADRAREPRLFGRGHARRYHGLRR